jgi:hypothetical protein
MYSGYPFKQATGVASEFVDARHMQLFARLLRDDTVFVDIESASDDTRQYVATHAAWPHAGSVGVAGGMGVVVLSGRVAPGN